MTNLANHCARDKAATGQAETQMCMIVGWRRIKGSFADLHAIADNGTILVREGNDFRVMYSDGVLQGLRS
jgi:hypothetical protein